MSANIKTCEHCGEPATINCRFCGEVWYCSEGHKRSNWTEHYINCKPYKITETPDAGKFLVASRDIPPGKQILKDEPIAIGPLVESELVCLSCHSLILRDDFYRCPDCSWPMCSIECASQKCHDIECEILSKDKKRCGVPEKQGKTPRYDLIFILRCLLTQMDPQVWSIMQSMANHWEEKKKESDPFQIAAVRYFTEVCDMNQHPDVIHKIRSVITTNAVQIQGPNHYWLRALYPIMRLFNHSCIPNVQLSSNLDGSIEARASVPIKKGDTLYITYTSIDVPLWVRQKCLRENYYFSCLCQRCKDPTELGTNFSAFRCSFCVEQFLRPEKVDGSVWVCPDCKRKCEIDEIIQEMDDWSFRLQSNELFSTCTPNRISYALALIEQHFHNKHYLWMTAAKLALQKLAYNDSYQAFRLKKHIWENFLELCDIFEPGFTNKRGMVLFELAKVLLDLTDDKFLNDGDTSLIMISNYLLKAKDTFEKSYNILKNESKKSMEYAVATSIPHRMSDIDAKITKLHCS